MTTYRPKSSVDVSLHGKHAKGQLPRVGAKRVLTIHGRVNRVSSNQFSDGAPSATIGMDVSHVTHAPMPMKQSLSDLIAAKQQKVGA